MAQNGDPVMKRYDDCLCLQYSIELRCHCRSPRFKSIYLRGLRIDGILGNLSLLATVLAVKPVY
jgi:hypothetical protein